MEKGVVLCNPLEDDSAIRHFMQHGLHLKDDNQPCVATFWLSASFQQIIIILDIWPATVGSSEQKKPATTAADSIVAAVPRSAFRHTGQFDWSNYSATELRVMYI